MEVDIDNYISSAENFKISKEKLIEVKLLFNKIIKLSNKFHYDTNTQKICFNRKPEMKIIQIEKLNKESNRLFIQNHLEQGNWGKYIVKIEESNGIVEITITDEYSARSISNLSLSVLKEKVIDIFI